jgi:hypothetical protein
MFDKKQVLTNNSRKSRTSLQAITFYDQLIPKKGTLSAPS